MAENSYFRRGDMEDLFKSFCAFGAGKESTAMMDNAKFAKLCRDCKLHDKNFTSTDADIIFSKVKAKTDFKQFGEALILVSEKKYPGDAEGRTKLDAILNADVETAATKADQAVAEVRLTDTSEYTGSHKQRFHDNA